MFTVGSIRQAIRPNETLQISCEKTLFIEPAGAIKKNRPWRLESHSGFLLQEPKGRKPSIDL